MRMLTQRPDDLRSSLGSALVALVLGLGVGLVVTGLHVGLTSFWRSAPQLLPVLILLGAQSRRDPSLLTFAFGLGLAVDIVFGSPLGIHGLSAAAIAPLALRGLMTLPLPGLAREMVVTAGAFVGYPLACWTISHLTGYAPGSVFPIGMELLWSLPATVVLAAIVGMIATLVQENTRGRRARVHRGFAR